MKYSKKIKNKFKILKMYDINSKILIQNYCLKNKLFSHINLKKFENHRNYSIFRSYNAHQTFFFPHFYTNISFIHDFLI